MINSKKILFRCDGSKSNGLGHLVRSLTLAKELFSSHNIRAVFAVREDNTGQNYIRNENIPLVTKHDVNETEEKYLDDVLNQEKPDALLIDSKYPYTKEMILKWKDHCNVIIIDDPCPGMSSADLLIFPVAHSSKKLDSMYNWGKEGNADLYHGKEYVLLSDRILKYQRNFDREFSNPSKMTITTGGSDPSGVMIKLLNYLIENPIKIMIEAVIGDSFAHRSKLKTLVKKLPKSIKLIPFSKNIFLNSDIVITTFGITLYELLFLGIPTLSIAHSIENTIDGRRFKKRYDCFDDLGYIEDLKAENLLNSLENMITNEKYRKYQSKKGMELIDGKGLQRVGEKIMLLLDKD